MSKNKIQQLTLQLYALLPQYLRDDYPDSEWLKLFRALRSIGVIHIEKMSDLWEQGGVWNGPKFQPYKMSGGTWDLFHMEGGKIVPNYNEPYWSGDRRLVDLLKKAGIASEITSISKFQARKWEYNKNGIADMITDRKAWPLQAMQLRRHYQTRRVKYGPTRVLNWRPSNEVAHNGDHAHGALINNHHCYLAENLLGDRILSPRHIVGDVSHSDFAIPTEKYYRVRLKSGKIAMYDRAEMALASAAGIVAEILQEWGDDKYGRQAQLEPHSMDHIELLQPYEEGAEMSWLARLGSSAWRRLRLSTDASVNGSVINPRVSWVYRDMSPAEILVFRDIISEFPARIWVSVAELPKSPFFTNDKNFIEENFMLLWGDMDRLSYFKSNREV